MRILLVVALVATVTLGFGSGVHASASASQVAVDVDLLHGFAPRQVDASTGTTIIWRNVERTDYPVVRGAHTVVADDGSFRSREIAPGTTWSLQILVPGTYAYHCSLHPSLLSGVLVVAGPKIQAQPNRKQVDIVEPSQSDEQTWGYDPPDLAGGTGLTVTWRNDGALAHTVTAEGFDSGPIDPGHTYTRTFSKAISLRYFCSLHTWMRGTIRIGTSGAPPPPPDAARPVPRTPVEPVRGSAPVTLHVDIVEPSATDPRSWGFSPQTLVAIVGDTVVWTNTGVAVHTVTGSGFDSGTLPAGGRFSYRAGTTGVFGYVCKLHPWMKGTVRVTAAGTRVVAPLRPPRRGAHSAPARPSPIRRLLATPWSRNAFVAVVTVDGLMAATGLALWVGASRRRRRVPLSEEPAASPKLETAGRK